jgi:FtsH-binding integral membrane protein
MGAALLLWFVAAWIGGSAAILGSLMTIAALLLWLTPEKSPSWQNRLKLLGFSVGMAIVGFTLLTIFPFSSTQ